MSFSTELTCPSGMILFCFSLVLNMMLLLQQQTTRITVRLVYICLCVCVCLCLLLGCLSLKANSSSVALPVISSVFDIIIYADRHFLHCLKDRLLPCCSFCDFCVTFFLNPVWESKKVVVMQSPLSQDLEILFYMLMSRIVNCHSEWKVLYRWNWIAHNLTEKGINTSLKQTKYKEHLQASQRQL